MEHAWSIPLIPLVLALVVKQVHVVPEQGILIRGVVVQQPLNGDDHVVDTRLAPEAFEAGSANGVALAVVAQHDVGEVHELAQRAQDRLLPRRVGLGKLRETKEEGGSRPKVSLRRDLGADPPVFGLQVENDASSGVDLVLQSRIVEEVGQRDQTVEPVGECLVQGTVVGASCSGCLEPPGFVDELVKVVLMAGKTMGHLKRQVSQSVRDGVIQGSPSASLPESIPTARWPQPAEEQRPMGGLAKVSSPFAIPRCIDRSEETLTRRLLRPSHEGDVERRESDSSEKSHHGVDEVASFPSPWRHADRRRRERIADEHLGPRFRGKARHSPRDVGFLPLQRRVGPMSHR